MKKSSLVIAVAGLMFALAVLPARAGNGRWTPYGPPAGSLSSLAVHPSGRILLATEVSTDSANPESGVYASDDDGRSWSWSGTGMLNERVRALVVDPEDGDVYAVGMTRSFRSTDQGRTWAVRAQGLALGEPAQGGWGDLLVLVPGEPDTLFLARDKSLFRSPDGGATWESVNFQTQTTIASFLVDPDDDQSLFVGTRRYGDGIGGEALPGGLFHSADGGQTWSEIIQPEEPPYLGPPFSSGVYELAALPGSPGTFFAMTAPRLFRSTDNGVTWQSVAPALPPGVGYYSSVAAVPGSPDTIFTLQQLESNDGYARVGLYASQNLGATWTRVDDGKISPSMQLVTAADGELYGLGPAGFGRGENGGADWRNFWVGSGCGSSATFSYGGLLRWSPDGSRVFSLVGSRLFQSTDGGRSWSHRSQSFSESCVHLADVQIDPSRPERLFLATEAGVYRSDNSGASWKAMAPPGDLENVPVFSTLAISQDVLVGGGFRGIERSTDGGRTWQTVLSRDTFTQGGGPATRFVTRLRVDPKRPRVVYAEVTKETVFNPPVSERVVYRSTDGGKTWRSLSAGATLVAVDPRTPRTLYLVKKGRLLRSLDDGRTWKALGNLPDGELNDLLVDRADSRILYAAGNDTVFRSTDGGATWSPFGSGLRGVAGNLLRDPRRPVLYTGGHGLFQINVPGV